MIYLTKLSTRKQARYFLWGTQDDKGEDLFLLDAGAVDFVCAATLVEVTALAQVKSPDGKLVSSEPVCHFDFEVFWRRLSQVNANRYSNMLVCKCLLDGWNFLEDFARPIGIDLKRLHGTNSNAITDEVYQKLFYGSNFPAFTPVGKLYKPIWGELELRVTRAYLHAIWLELGIASKQFNAFAEGVITE